MLPSKLYSYGTLSIDRRVDPLEIPPCASKQSLTFLLSVTGQKMKRDYYAVLR